MMLVRISMLWLIEYLLINQIKGGGFENIDNYTNCELYFCEIENIHNARSALNKIWSLSYSKM
jgi:hypothetical protein